MFAGFYFWWPKLTGRMLGERLGKIHFWMLFIGFHVTFFVQHLIGIQGMPRRYADYLPEDGFTLGNQISTAGATLLGLSMLPFFYNVWHTWRHAPLVETDDPWRYGGSARSDRPSTCTTPRPRLRGCTTRGWREATDWCPCSVRQTCRTTRSSTRRTDP